MTLQPPIQPQNPILNPEIQLIQIINPPNQAITIRLTDANYSLWRQQVLGGARGFGLEGYLLGTHPWPVQFLVGAKGPPGEIKQAFTVKDRQDQLLESWLLASISEGVLVNVVGNNTSSEIWNSLEGGCASQSRARIMQYKLQLQTLKKGSMLMRDYLTKMKALVNVLASAGQRLSEQDQILQVLSELGNEYDPVLAPVTTRSEPYTLKDVSALLLSFESRLKSSTPMNSNGTLPPANFAFQNNQKQRNQHPRFNSVNRAQFQIGIRGGRGGRVRGRGRGWNNGNRRGWNNGNRPQCQLCTKLGHVAERCYYYFDTSFRDFSLYRQNTNGFIC